MKMKSLIVTMLFVSLPALAEVFPVIGYDNDLENAKVWTGRMCTDRSTSNGNVNYGPGTLVGVVKCWDTTTIGGFQLNYRYLCASSCDRPVQQ